MQKTLPILAVHIGFLECSRQTDLLADLLSGFAAPLAGFAASLAESLWLSVRLQNYRGSASHRGEAANMKRGQTERQSLSARGAAKPPTASTRSLPPELSEFSHGLLSRGLESFCRSMPVFRHSATVYWLLLFLLLPTAASAQQIADPEFKAVVEHPAYTKNFPRVLFDEAHNNFHTTVGRYKPFADLIVSDGYYLVRNRKPFARASLDTVKLLIIANALGAEEDDDVGADSSAFTPEECQVVHDWVRSGGALLLIADHAPFGGAAQELAKQFGVEMSNGFVLDPEHSQAGASSILIFSREDKLLLDHPITRGRDDAEKINRVVAFTGQAMKTAEPGATFLQLGQAAREKPSRTSDADVSVAGQAQGLAFKFGKGRVVMLGEAAMLSAQISGQDKLPMGMNAPGNDNKQLALNIMHWLSGALK